MTRDLRRRTTRGEQVGLVIALVMLAGWVVLAGVIVWRYLT